jgi:hypothetical protein
MTAKAALNFGTKIYASPTAGLQAPMAFEHRSPLCSRLGSPIERHNEAFLLFIVPINVNAGHANMAAELGASAGRREGGGVWMVATGTGVAGQLIGENRGLGGVTLVHHDAARY